MEVSFLSLCVVALCFGEWRALKSLIDSLVSWLRSLPELMFVLAML